MIATLDWDIRAADVTLPVTGGGINIDDQSVPAITATVIVPFDADVLAAIDPRSTVVPRVTLNGTLSEWSSQPLAAMSAYAATVGGTIADLSTAWAGLQLGDVTVQFAAPLHAGAQTENQTMSLDLHVREVSYDDWEMVVSLASDEALLLDWSATSEADRQLFLDIRDGLDSDEINAWIEPTLRVVLGYGLQPSVYDTDPLSVPPADLLTPIRETNAWNYMRPFLEDTDLKLRVSSSGRGFTLHRPENSITGNSHLFEPADVISARGVYSRTGDWYDSAELVSDVSPDVGYPAASHSRTYVENFGTRQTSQSMAQNIVRRTVNRGQFIDLVAPIRLGVFMRDEFTYLPEGATPGPPYQWIAKAVSYDLAGGLMNIRGERRY